MNWESRLQHISVYIDQRLRDLEKDLLEKIKSLEFKYEAKLKDMAQTKIELTAAKAYIHTLPTQQEVQKLKSSLSSLKEESEQKHKDFACLQETNTILHSKICTLQNKVRECENELQNKIYENNALKYTIELWENRRKAAIQSGQVTVEDVVADKMKLEEHFKDMLQIAACREQHLKARISRLKTKLDDEKRISDDLKKTSNNLEKRIAKFESELEENSLKYLKVEEANKCLQESVILITEEVQQLKIRERVWHKIVSSTTQCMAGISKCGEAVKNIINFVEDALSNKHLDPALLFPTCHYDSETREINEKDLEKLVEQRVVEIKELDSQVRGCQQTITDMYVSKLSNVDVSQCQIQ